MSTLADTLLADAFMALAVAAVLGLLVGLAGGPVLRRLAEPDDTAPGGKIRYAALATPRFAQAVGAFVAAAALSVLATGVPGEPRTWLAWPLATVGVLLVCIDAVTTWLPLRLTQGLWGLTVAAWLAACLAGAAWWPPLIGAAIAGGFFWLVWRISGSIGFGDVRLMPVIGAVAAAYGGQTLLAALVLGTALGALTGLVHLIRHGRGPFPYGPSLVAGAFAALAVG
ncbi:prepilin peptidase [Granulicoccus phenolivorans]|uniref:prepilin peptidase n=1 Tax=Granulicoccus phenolivorans TaxID=266854 RepID=UPI00041AEF1D|nr:A24 family peptidase [Granulicoccus phenolivorans]